MTLSLNLLELVRISQLKMLDEPAKEALYDLMAQQEHLPQTAWLAGELLRASQQKEQNMWWSIEKMSIKHISLGTYDLYQSAILNYLPALHKMAEYYLNTYMGSLSSSLCKIYLSTKLLLLSKNVNLALMRYPFMDREVIANYTQLAHDYLLGLPKSDSNFGYSQLADQCLKLVEAHITSIVLTPDALLLQESDEQFVLHIQDGMRGLNNSYAGKKEKMAFDRWIDDQKKSERVKIYHPEEFLTDFTEAFTQAENEILAAIKLESPQQARLSKELLAYAKTPVHDKVTRGILAARIALKYDVMNNIEERDRFNVEAVQLRNEEGTFNHFYNLCKDSRFISAMDVMKQYYESSDTSFQHYIIEELKDDFLVFEKKLTGYIVAKFIHEVSPEQMTGAMYAALKIKITKPSFFKPLAAFTLSLTPILEFEDEANVDEQAYSCLFK